jgi:transposase InsO family protein
VLDCVDEAVCAGARLEKVCELIGVSPRTVQRWRRGWSDRRRGPKSPVTHQLTADEQEEILAVANSPAYRNLSPERVVAKLADEGSYICSEASLRRVLKRHAQDAHRQRSKPGVRRHKPREYVAREPLRVLTWDITYLRDAMVRGNYFYLYLFIDIWSRLIVWSEVHSIQSADLAADALRCLCAKHGVETERCVLHSDNGAPMKGSTMVVTAHDLGITRSFSRPQVSDDNAHIESLFRHLKYAPSYPTRGFDDLAHARRWVARFVAWYNEQHLHSAIGYVTPDDRHHGRDIELLQKRRDLYEMARKRNPRRWTSATRKWNRPAIVTLNPDRTVELAPSSSIKAA